MNSLSITGIDYSESTFKECAMFISAQLSEAASLNIKFIRKQPEMDKPFYKTINSFRVIYSHNMPGSQSDNFKKKAAQSWFFDLIGKNVCDSTYEWEICIRNLFKECIQILNEIFAWLEKISSDPDKDITVQTWTNYITKTVPIHICEAICKRVFDRFGIDLDVSNYCKKKYPIWISKLQDYSLDSDFEIIIERFIENDVSSPEYCPLGGRYITSLIGHVDAQKLIEYINYAKSLYKEHIYTFDEIKTQILLKFENEQIVS